VNEFQFHRPRSLDEAFRLMEETEGAAYLAGGTDVFVGEDARHLPAVISLRSVPGLSGIDGDRIGAATPVRDLIDDAGLRARFPVLVQAARLLGSPQIRNVATIGGNLCRAAPCADLAPPLLALGARLRLQRPGADREVAMQDFMVGPGQTCLQPGELLTEIVLDPPRPDTRALFLKKGRARMDLSLVSVAVLLVMQGDCCTLARIAAGAVAPTPVRLVRAEALLQGHVPGDDVLLAAQEAAAEDVAPISDVRASAGYRRRIVGVYVGRALRQLLHGSEA